MCSYSIGNKTAEKRRAALEDDNTGTVQGMETRQIFSNASCSMLLPGPFIACALLRAHSETTRLLNLSRSVAR